jgi:hypothetical protein
VPPPFGADTFGERAGHFAKSTPSSDDTDEVREDGESGSVSELKL